MTHAVRSCMLTFCLAVLSTGLAFTQTSTSAASPAASVTPADVDFVYVGTHKGVYLYDATSSGMFNLVPGSPFQPTGLMIGSNGKYFISLGTDYVHSYSVASNGAIGHQVSQINTQNYYGSDCGTTAGAVLDHTGEYVYVQLAGALNGSTDTICDALQTYKISSTSGALTFVGSTLFDVGSSASAGSPLAITGNGAYAYNLTPVANCQSQRNAFRRESNGTLEATGFNETDPNPSGWGQSTVSQAADSTNHLAAANYLTTGCIDAVPAQLVSYTVDAQGDITTTNTYENAPTPAVYPQVLSISPSGKLLAAGGHAVNATLNGTQSTGFELFNFDGANPITFDDGRQYIFGDPIDQIVWDNNNAVYALSDSEAALWVYTATPNFFGEATGSPLTIPASPNALAVVSNVCSAPASPGVKICIPASGPLSEQPVLVKAAARVTGTIANMQLWVDGGKNYTSTSNTLTTSLILADEPHRLAVIAINKAGQKWESVVNVTGP